MTMQDAIITNIQGFSIHDGPGIRTVVFFKGCPLSCRWCANPECLSPRPQTGFIENLCSGCGKCLDACPNGAIRRAQGVHRIDYSRCKSCGRCVEQCLYGALVRYGEPMSVEAVLEAIRRDKMFYDSSGGGVTVSGGEPLLYDEFIYRLFELCRVEAIDTCMETCGFADSAALLRLIPVTDHFLFDLKHMDPEAHREYTGRSNEQILKNAEIVARLGRDVVFRQPLIPGINDSESSIDATARFLKGLGKEMRLQIMPFHRMGAAKYKALDLPYAMEKAAPADDARVEAVVEAYMRRGIACSISR